MSIPRQSLHKLLIELQTRLCMKRMTGCDQAWLLHTKGSCGIHIDFEDKSIFSFLLCVHTHRPCTMEFAHVVGRQATTADFVAPRTIKMITGSWIVFPSTMSHRCVADGSNARTIINCVAAQQI